MLHIVIVQQSPKGLEVKSNPRVPRKCPILVTTTTAGIDSPSIRVCMRTACPAELLSHIPQRTLQLTAGCHSVRKRENGSSDWETRPSLASICSSSVTSGL